MSLVFRSLARLRARSCARVIVVTVGALSCASCGLEGASGKRISTRSDNVKSDRDSSPAGAAKAPLEDGVAAEVMVGVLVPAAEVVIVAPSTARLDRLDLEVGDHVKADEVLAQLDVRGERNELGAATAAWRSAKAELEELELELEQARATRADIEQLEDYVSRAELREQRFAERLAEARKRSAGAELEVERSAIDSVRRRLEEAELQAPFAGSIAARYVDPGASLGLGDPIVSLLSDERVLRFAVPEQLGERLRLGAALDVRFESPRGDVVELEAVVTSIAPEVDAGTRLILAEARLDPSSEVAQLLIGAVARVRFAAP
ncbi:efflux RND transporter periplasmic adaptor subunit [Pseudenhygromyxa sp. WMMC2535]|uniref:efflux RND transporter periplasmic adaptor subunit n=1 Tax=Pseudenhygromyxa sp. WMMC2535 TaxID=2712867 RepID=UPI0015958411|nr:efflux RND transporter periplasmic adaptor subunit [Pseudenhygromyxa sp. WMMC2535]NVB41662.1 efflux RND transporter periplasmic adaptor subunit [Pseudenhygromyxa sp. WMMC2535]